MEEPKIGIRGKGLNTEQPETNFLASTKHLITYWLFDFYNNCSYFFPSNKRLDFFLNSIPLQTTIHKIMRIGRVKVKTFCGRRENAGHRHFCYLPQCFRKLSGLSKFKNVRKKKKDYLKSPAVPQFSS